MKKLKSSISTLVLAFGFASVAQAQWQGYHFAAGSFTAPKDLHPVGQKIEPVKHTYYVRDGLINYEVLTPEGGRIKIPEGFIGKVFVEYEGKILSETIKSALRSRGVQVTDERNEARIALRGRGGYIVTLPPHHMRRLPLDQTFDERNGEGVTIVGAQSAKTSRGEALLNLSTSAATFSLNPAEFVGNLITAAMDMSGASSRIERALGVPERQRKEQSITFGDCYDNETRKGSCEPGQARNLAYTLRTRLQVVDLRTSVVIDGVQYKPVNIVARIIDDRTETKDDFPELLTAAITELLAPFPAAHQPAAVAAPKPATISAMEPASATTETVPKEALVVGEEAKGVTDAQQAN